MNELHVGDKIYHSDSDILNGFREHFQSLSTPNDVPGYDKRYGHLVSSELREIIDICRTSQDNNSSTRITLEQVQKAISSLNRGKAADFYGVTSEHFLYRSGELLQVRTDIVNELYCFGELTESLKTGILTPVYKKKGASTDAKNYRGITILPTLTKILVTILKDTVRPEQTATRFQPELLANELFAHIIRSH